MLNMKTLARVGKVEEAAVLRYIVNGLQIKNEFKVAMYRCQSYRALKEEYDIYELVQEPSNSNDRGEAPTNNKKYDRKEEKILFQLRLVTKGSHVQRKQSFSIAMKTDRSC